MTSLAVETELGAGESPNKAEMLQLAARFPLLDVNEAVIEADVRNAADPAVSGGESRPAAR
ncbi:MAG: hypothetical protein JSS49_23455 [Planctomycetes bacterium]|nr:hypothetical protein [Planctomycetota bacterium]